MRILNLDRTQYSVAEYWQYCLMGIAVLLTLFYQTYFTLASNVAGIMWGFIIDVLLFFSIISFIKTHTLNSISRFYIKLIPYFLIVGILSGITLTNNIIGFILCQDLRFVLLFAAGCCFAHSKRGMVFFHQLMIWVGLIAIIMGLYALLTFNFSIEVIEGREDSWTLSYFLWWASAGCFAYWGLYALLCRKNFKLGIGVLLIYFVLGVLFLKRSAFLNGIIIIILYFLLQKNKSKTIKKLLVLSMIFFTLTKVFLPSLFDNVFSLLFSRFADDNTLAEQDRNVEMTNYFNAANVFQLLFGNGIGHYASALSIRNSEGILNALHVGYANIIYKGGVLYALFYVKLYTKILPKIAKKNLPQYKVICVGVAISALISLVYEGSWTYTILPFCISAPMFYAANDID